MGYRIVAELAGLILEARSSRGHGAVTEPRWGGYLANVTPSEFEQSYLTRLPAQIRGDEFLSRYGGTTDPVTRVEPDRVYPVRAPTAHPIHEHFRVRAFAELLLDVSSQRRLALLGELMYQSHSSYTSCGLGSPGTDRIVELVREAGERKGMFGAKITGGGSGGTVAVLGHANAGVAVNEIAEQYRRETGKSVHTFSGSSPGAGRFGHLVLRTA
jgi:galactokinase